MPRDTLLDFFDDRIRSSTDFLVYDDGYRPRRFTYDEARRAAVAFADRLREAGLRQHDKVLCWGENRPEWVIAFWGCLLAGVIVVPIDYRASPELLRRVLGIVGARLVLVGDEVEPPPLDSSISVWQMSDLADTCAGPPARRAERVARGVSVGGDDLAEIIFTSGATAEPKGVQITHRNILANIVPVEREVVKYRKYGRPFLPLRFLNLLPLSHMFGQAMATFIPPMLPGVCVFIRGYNPVEIIEQIKRRRISVLVCVPKILDVLRDHVRRVAPEVDAAPPAEKRHWLMRWWQYRRLHRLFGWKFWAFVVGAAPLDPELEEFWSRLGFLVIQGYGLTETAPIVTLNHPFRARRGTVGTPIAGVEVKIAPDGEILVRGENVTSGYYNLPEETARVFENGWFHTGDIGELDQSGRLVVRGRKKDVVVTPEGLNVFPEDVERALLETARVREAAVVGVSRGGEERVHAVLVLDGDSDAETVIREANARLEDHQKIRSFSLWPGEALPRTEGTQKLKRAAVRQWVATGQLSGLHAGDGDSVAAIVGRFAGDRRVTDTTTLDELGLSSLERIELMMALEERLDRPVDDATLASATTIGDLGRRLEQEPAGKVPVAAATADALPRWSRHPASQLVRTVSLATWVLPLARLFAWIRVDGREHVDRLETPVVYAANHQSHMDTPVILAALPGSRRYRVAPAMAKEFFHAHFHPAEHTRRERLTNGLNYVLAALFFNAFPLPQREGGTRQALRYIGELVADGFSILIFPEGRRVETGEIATFQPGIGMIASRLRVPVVPVRVEGMDRILPPAWRMARPGRVRVAFGPVLRLEGDDYVALARQVEDAVRRL